MFGLIKLVVAFLIAIIIYNHFLPSFENKKKDTAKEHICSLGGDKCKLCPKKKRSLFDPPKPKEIVFYLKEGQVLEEHQVLFNTDEGKKLYHQRVAWLRDICNEYAEKVRNSQK